jgi:hypothetical protein
MRRIIMAGRDKISVLNPMGFPPKVTRQSLAPRLDALDGKTVDLGRDQGQRRRRDRRRRPLKHVRAGGRRARDEDRS